MPKTLPAVSVALIAGNALAKDDFNALPPSDRLSLILVYVVFCLGLGLGFVVIAAIYNLLRPQAVRRTDQVIRNHPVRSLILGVAAVAVLILAGALADAVPAFGVVVLLLALPLLYLGIAGLAGISHCLGDKLLSNVNSRFAGSSFVAVVGGGVLLALLNLVPFLGFFLLGTFAVVGLGAAIAGLFRRRDVPGTAPPVPPAKE